MVRLQISPVEKPVEQRLRHGQATLRADKIMRFQVIQPASQQPLDVIDRLRVLFFIIS